MTIEAPGTTKEKNDCSHWWEFTSIITASVLQEDGHECTIYEQHDAPGGVWSHAAYPGVRLQCFSWHYRHPDLVWPFQVDENVTEEQIIFAYIEHCIEHFGLTVKLQTDSSRSVSTN
jgi:cation diffusion facilitator CzcD-associated flavoprotein CzcO